MSEELKMEGSTIEQPVTETPKEEVKTETPAVTPPVKEDVKTETPAVTPEEEIEWPDLPEAFTKTFPAKYLNKDGKPDLQKFLAGHQALEKKLGQKGVSTVTDPGEYSYKFGEDKLVDDAKLTEFRTEAHKLGMSQQQYEFAMRHFEAQVDRFIPTPKMAETTLKAEWGSDYKENLKHANEAYMAYVPSELSNDPILNHPTVLKVLARVGAELGEDTISNKKPMAGAAMTKAEKDELMASPDYWTNAEKQAKVAAWYEKNVK